MAIEPDDAAGTAAVSAISIFSSLTLLRSRLSLASSTSLSALSHPFKFGTMRIVGSSLLVFWRRVRTVSPSWPLSLGCVLSKRATRWSNVSGTGGAASFSRVADMVLGVGSTSRRKKSDKPSLFCAREETDRICKVWTGRLT